MTLRISPSPHFGKLSLYERGLTMQLDSCHTIIVRFPARSEKRLASSVKRLVLSAILFAICYFLFAISPASAQTYQDYEDNQASQPYAANPYLEPNTNPDVPKNLHTHTQNLLIEVLAAVSCQLSGIDPVNPNNKCLGVDNKTGKIGFVESGGGAIGVMGNLIAMTYTPPTHTGEYFSHLAGNFGITKQAYAQQNVGGGFRGILPLLALWQKFRDITYLLFVIVFVVIGIAIMLRVKIDPRTVMTLQNQIPKIIVGIVMVTFSFAIVGFLIDVMYASIYLVGNTVISADKRQDVRDSNLVLEITQSQNPWGGANKMANGPESGTAEWIKNRTGFGLADIAARPANDISGYIAKMFDNPPGKIITGFAGAAIGHALAKPINTASNKVLQVLGFGATAAAIAGTGGTAAAIIPLLGITVASALPVIIGTTVGVVAGNEILGLLGSIITFLIILIAILWSLFRVWFMLIQAYIFLLIDLVTAPFWVLMGLFPGSPLSFGVWIRDVMANLSVFTMTIVMFLLGRVFMDSFATAGERFVPPMVGAVANPKSFSALMGLGIILLIPNMLALAKAAFKAPKFDITPIKQALGTAPGILGGAFGLAMQGLMLKSYGRGTLWDREKKPTVLPPMEI